MSIVRLYFEGERFGSKWKKSMEGASKKVKEAIRGAAHDAGEEFVAKASADISRAGNFGSRWTEGFKVSVTEGGGSIRLEIKHSVPYFNVFQTGATIHGKPLLWIPFSDSNDKMRARDYPGQLFRTQRKSDGLDLLGDTETKEMKYFGKESVTIPKKFHMEQVGREVAKELPALFKARMMLK